MSVLDAFERYQKARVLFAQNVADLSVRPATIETMQDAGVMQLLRPLLLDNVPSIQQSAALALGRLANHSDDLAEAVVGNEILPQLVYSLAEQNRFYKKQVRRVATRCARGAHGVWLCVRRAATLGNASGSKSAGGGWCARAPPPPHPPHTSWRESKCSPSLLPPPSPRPNPHCTSASPFSSFSGRLCPPLRREALARARAGGGRVRRSRGPGAVPRGV